MTGFDKFPDAECNKIEAVFEESGYEDDWCDCTFYLLSVKLKFLFIK